MSTSPDSPVPASESPGSPSRTEASNALIRPLLEAEAWFEPERLSAEGFSGVDDEVTRRPVDRVERKMEVYASVRSDLARRLEEERCAELRFDLGVTVAAVDREIEWLETEREIVPCFSPARCVYEGTAPALGSASPDPGAIRRRLERYAGLETGRPSLCAQAEEELRARLDRGTGLMPWRGEIRAQIDEIGPLLQALRRRLERSDEPGWEPAFDVLAGRLDRYAGFLRDRVLPRARADFRLPREVYGAMLRRWGVDSSPDELIRHARAAAQEIRSHMETLARRLGHGRSSAPGARIEASAELRAGRLTGRELVDRYRRRLEQLAERVEGEGVLTLPAIDFEVESAPGVEAARSAPYLDFPRRLVPPSGRKPEPVRVRLPVTEHGEPTFDDFAFEAATWTWAAHEGVPGHGVQLGAGIAREHSWARSFCGYDVSTVEGWAGYMEAEMQPYLPVAARFVALQRRLLIATRVVVEPLLHRGRLREEEAVRCLCEDVGVSEAMARRELERYCRIPGHAVTYFSGYVRVLDLRAETEHRLGGRFDRRELHDLLLELGPVPVGFWTRESRERLGASACRRVA